MTWQDIARTALAGAENDTIPFPQSVAMLMAAGFDGYAVDFRHATRIYYRPDGETLRLETAPTAPVAALFDAAIVRDAIRAAQAMAPGYTYPGFCARDRKSVVEGKSVAVRVALGGRRIIKKKKIRQSQYK